MERESIVNKNEITHEDVNRAKAEAERSEMVSKLIKFGSVFVVGALVIALSMM